VIETSALSPQCVAELVALVGSYLAGVLTGWLGGRKKK